MKVLTVTNMWPYPKKLFYGIFVKEQADALSAFYPEINNRIWFLKGYLSKLQYIFSIFSINLHLLFHKYDVIHVHSALSGIFLLFAPQRKNVIITLHGTEILDPEQFRISKQVIAKANLLICVSAEIECVVKKSRPDSRTRVIPCAVREQFFVDERKKESNAIKIAFASGRNRSVKNFALFEKIIQSLESIFPNDNIQTIEFDNKSREEILADLNGIDLLLMTSFHEGSPQIVKEAMCCNTPVVSSNVGTVKYLLEGVDNCRVIDGYETKDYVDAIAGILQKNAYPLRSTGRKRIYDLGYDEKTITNQIMAIYKSIASPQHETTDIKY